MSLTALYLALLTTLGAPPVTEDLGTQPQQVGELDSTYLASSHPYPAGGAVAATVERRELRHPGATYMVVHFSRFELAAGDEVVVRDTRSVVTHRYRDQGRMNGAPFWSFSVPGDTVILELHSRGMGGIGYEVDQYEHGFEEIFTRSICGVDDKRNARCYQASNPTHYQKSRAVARLRFCGSLCTGWLVSCNNHFITNQHCRNTTCGLSGYEVWFDYETPTCAGGTAVQVVTGFAADLRNSATLDYWLVQLSSDAAATFGSLQLDPRPPVLSEQIYIPQHPGGQTKKLAIASDMDVGQVCRIDDPNRNGNGTDTDAGYYCDTEGGSSGSPVISEQSQRVVLLHHFGIGSAQCDATLMNAGVRIEHIEPEIRQFLPACSYCTPLAAPLNLQAVDNGSNQIDLGWDPIAGAGTYRILRSDTGCAGPLVPLASTAGTSWPDTPVSGGSTYGYVVQAISPDLCFGAQSSCLELTATGDCILAPTFAGAANAVTDLGGNCAIDLDWPASVGRCSSDVVYNVYRGSVAGFTPDATSLVASCVPTLTYRDTAVVPGARYFYVVRAEDRQGVGTGLCAGGVEDTNTVELPARAVAGTPLVDFTDDAESATTMTLNTPWMRNNVLAAQGAFSYRADGQTSLSCSGLVTPPLVLTSNSILSYAHRQDLIELDAGTVAWDGATVELSVDNGVTWKRLEPTPPYPNTFLPVSSCCNNDRVGGGCYSGTSTAWGNATVDLGSYAGREVRVRFLMATDGGTVSNFWYIDDIRVTGVATSPCAGATCVPLPSSVARLLATKRPTANDVTFGWSAASVGFFRVNSVDVKTALPAYAATGAVARCATPDASTLGCVQAGATPNPPANTLYYSVVGVCSGDPTIEGP